MTLDTFSANLPRLRRCVNTVPFPRAHALG
jgi:hypothetical protein